MIKTAENVVLIGAGSAMFTRGLVCDMIRRGWQGELRLVDTDPHALGVAEGLARKMIEASGSRLRVRGCTERRDVLRGATAVICTVGVGGRRAWEKDVFIPREFGIYQPVGDSVMPGGTSRALRMIPAMVSIARDVLDLAPNALFFNYSNPMAPICRAVHKATDANMVGLCHGVFQVAEKLAGLLDIASGEMRYTAVGMNHLTWFLHISDGDRDAMPRLLAIAKEKQEQGISTRERGKCFEESGGGTAKSAGHALDDPFTWQMASLFGAFPAVMDRHITEFFPHMFGEKHGYFGHTLGVDAYAFESVIQRGDDVFSEMASLALSPEPLAETFFKEQSGEHEQVAEIIESIRTDARRVYSANLSNCGQVPNLPHDAIVEAPAVAGAAGLELLQQDPLPVGICGTLASRFQWVETVVEAALEGSREKFVQALLLDGAVKSVDMAAQLADRLLDAHIEFLPQFKEKPPCSAVS